MAFYPDSKNLKQRHSQKLCPVRIFKVYLDKTSSYRKPGVNQLFISFKKGCEGLPVSKVRIASWLVSIITQAYVYFHKEVPVGIRAHSTRAVGSSLACFRGVCLEDICKAATWSEGTVFAKHYHLDMVPQGSSLSYAVLAGPARF